LVTRVKDLVGLIAWSNFSIRMPEFAHPGGASITDLAARWLPTSTRTPNASSAVKSPQTLPDRLGVSSCLCSGFLPIDVDGKPLLASMVCQVRMACCNFGGDLMALVKCKIERVMTASRAVLFCALSAALPESNKHGI
jgi:hypothetical protein